MSSKKRKISFSPNSCCFCCNELSSDKQVLNPKTFDSLLDVCSQKNDEISQNIIANEENIRNGTLQLSYHKTCRIYYLRNIPCYEATSIHDLNQIHLIGSRTASSMEIFAVANIGQNGHGWRVLLIQIPK